MAFVGVCFHGFSAETFFFFFLLLLLLLLLLSYGVQPLLFVRARSIEERGERVCVCAIHTFANTALCYAKYCPR